MTLLAGFQDSRVVSHLGSYAEHSPAIKAFHAAATPASTAWPAANRAYFVPFRVSVPTLVVEILFTTGTSPGTTNFDLGIYRDDFVRIASLGATACVNSTNSPMPAGGGDIADTVLAPGRYYMAMSSAATSLTAIATVQANGIMRALGLQMMESAHPLPATATPVSVGTSAFLPFIWLATVTNTL